MDKKGKFERMAEWMRNGCKDEGAMADRCSMMKKMLEQKKRGKKRERRTVKRRIGQRDSMSFR